MTYCLGMMLEDGLVFASDSRTNAGVDSVATFRKLFVFDQQGERVFVLLTAGNLAITQEIVGMVERSLYTDDVERSIFQAETMFHAARVISGFLRTVFNRDGEYFRAHATDFNASMILGGQIKGERPRLFLIYSTGNFIEAGEETPYFQLGETKYGKPILERVLTPHVSLSDAAKCALVSFDSTIRANISVAPPIDLAIYRRDGFCITSRQRIEEDDPYFKALRRHWGEGLKRVFSEAPDPPWRTDTERPLPAQVPLAMQR